MDAREQDGEDSAGESLSELLRAWRRRPLLRGRVPAAQQRRAQGLSQQEVARLSGVSERWYRSLELGKPANFSADFLDGLASALQLSPVERHVLYLKAAGRPPAEPEGDTEGVMDEQLQHFLDRHHSLLSSACSYRYSSLPPYSRSSIMNHRNPDRSFARPKDDFMHHVMVTTASFIACIQLFRPTVPTLADMI